MKVGATHLIGSEMYYEDLGGGNYLITLKVYRECGPANTLGTDFDDVIYLGVFYSSTNQLQQVENVFLNFSTVQNVPVIMTNPCGTPPPGLCVEEATYTTTLMLGSTVGGYDIAWQRCCRNPSINNLANAGGTNNPGMTATIHIPGSDEINSTNSSPVFQEFPPVALCANFEFFFDHSAIDQDGDELVYSFCAPFDGGNPITPVPNPPSSPPYSFVPYSGGYSSGYPIASDPAFAIDPVTGFITGTPNTPGQYAMGVCVEEFRDGVSLGRVLRDFQFNVTLCDANIVAAVLPQQPEQLCIGETLQFENNSVNGNDFIWDFGVSDTDSDVSTEFEPEFTFPDVGTYTVTLIANPTWPCADTSSQIFYVFMPLDPEIEMVGFDCIQGTETFDFEVTGTMNDEATYFWDFGTTGSPVSANIPAPVGVDFSNDDIWNIILTVNNNGCTADADFQWIAPEQPIASIEDQEEFCQGLTFTFENNSTNAETYLWDFGSPFGDDSSTEPNPEFTYLNSGSYTVTLTAYAPFTCPDVATMNIAVSVIVPNIVEVTLDICEGDSVTLADGTIVNEEGVYPVVLSSLVNDCDSTIITEVNISPIYNLDLDIDTCDDGSYLLPDGNSPTSSGLFDFSFQTELGCDSNITLNLQLYSAYNWEYFVEICEGELYTLPDGTEVEIEGEYTSVFQTIYGCDSITTVSVAVQDLPDLDLGLEESYCPYSGNITLTPLPSGGVLTGDLLNGYELEHIGVAPGTYSVSYIYTDSNGCMNTEYQEYIIAETINPSFNYEILCNELSFESSTFDPMDDYLYSWYLDDDLIVGVSQFTVSFLSKWHL